MATHERRDIDERDVDLLLAALTDREIAGTFGWSEDVLPPAADVGRFPLTAPDSDVDDASTDRATGLEQLGAHCGQERAA